MKTQIELTEEQRKYLVALLDSVCREKHAEVRRTEFSPSLHDELRREENLVRGLLQKVQTAETSCQA